MDTQRFTLSDTFALDDLRTYLERAARIEDGSVRLISAGGVLAAYSAVLYPIGLLDEIPTVLGLRTLAVVDTPDFDVVVPIRSLRARLESAAAAETTTIGVPLTVNTVTWTAITPPRGGWQAQATLDPARLTATANDGIAQVAEAVPGAVGEQIVRRVRSEVWGRPIAAAEYLPAGSAFAALSLGFLGDDEVRVYESGPWSRLTTARGHVLVKRRAWSLSA